MSCNFCRCTKPWWYFCNPVLLPSFLFSLWLPLGLFCFDHVEFAMTNFNDLKKNHQQTLKWLSTVDRGINTHYCVQTSHYSGKPFQCLLAVLLQVIQFCYWKFDMSWKKQSAEAGLAGLTLREAALGALWDETMVKKMPDTLGQILDLSRVKKEDLFMVVRFYSIQS